MKKFSILFYVLLIGLWMLQSCGDPSPIGAGVLDGERLNIEFQDTFPLSAQTIASEPLTTYRSNLDVRDRILGRLDDPLLGITETELYIKMGLSSSEPDFEGAVLDSVVLVVLYDSLGFYGDRDIEHTIEVFELGETFPDADTLQADNQLSTSRLLGSKTLVPSFRDSVLITSYTEDTLIRLTPQLRIPLDPSIGQAIIDNPELLEDNEALSAFLPGIAVKSTPDGSGTFGLNMSRSANAGGINAIKLYYNVGDTTKGIYNLIFSNQISSYFYNDPTGYPLADFIGDATSGDSLVVIQGLSGVNASVNFDDLSGVSADVINYAELVLFINDETGVDPDDYFPRNIVSSKINDEGDMVSTTDFSIAFSNGRLFDLFGGIPLDTVVNGKALQYISVNVTGHIKEILDDPSIQAKIIFSIASNIQIPGRTVLYGPGHSKYPMKLRITFTDIN